MSSLDAKKVFPLLEKSILADGYDVVMDLKKSKGARFYDSKNDRWYIDFFSFYASNPLGFNHPRMSEPDFEEKLLTVAKLKVANSDVYTTYLAEFVEYFHQHFAPQFERLFFIEGGALGVENALKAAQDWKVRKNLSAGRGEIGTEVLHFKNAFHGRTGYTLSLTNTVPDKTAYFPKFDWPRVSTPALRFPLTKESLAATAEKESFCFKEIRQAFESRPHRICAIIIETLQSEGGDNHFRKEFLKGLQDLCREYEALFILDEVQAGMGISGKIWAFEHYGIEPDLIAFGKKSQVCGTAANLQRLKEVDHVFKVSSRINSTWGGNIVDMVRSLQFMKIIREEKLLDHVNKLSPKIILALEGLARTDERISNVRGLGFLMAFDLPTVELRDRLLDLCWENGLMILKSGDLSIRIRPVLNIQDDEALEGVEVIRKSLKELK